VHVPDGFIDLPTSAAAAAVALPCTVVATRRAGRRLAERQVPLAGLVVAYLVVAQLLVFPLALGPGAHLLGTGLALVLVGPEVAMACVAVVLVIQSLVLADGGITALGLNAVNNGVVPLLVGWAVLAASSPLWRTRRRFVPVAAAGAAAAGVVAAALAFGVEYTIGGTDALDAGLVTAGFTAAHVGVGAIEGLLTGLLVAALARSRPDLLLGWWPVRSARPRLRRRQPEQRRAPGQAGAKPAPPEVEHSSPCQPEQRRAPRQAWAKPAPAEPEQML
jgi:cobalt/nickel transport system permease protein